MSSQISLKDIQGIIRRRKKLFILVFSLVFSLAWVIALILPPIYRAQAMILIEEQQIPEDYVKSTITSYAEERLQMITREIMSRANLKEIINANGLYPEMVSTNNIGDAVAKMKDSILLEPISSKSGTDSATVAFSISYEGEIPETVQKVTEALANLYLEKDKKARESLAGATTEFLEEELNLLRKQVKLHEEQLSDFKSQHMGALPENAMSNIQTISRLERDLDGILTRIRSLEERKLILQTQLDTIDPRSPVSTKAGVISVSPAVRLKQLRATLRTKQTTLSEKHPDIRSLKREIAELEAEIGPGGADPTVAEQPDNPVYINLMTQVVSAESEIKNLMADQAKVESDLEKYRRKSESSPMIEKEYNELTRDFDNAKKKYNEILDKLMSARVSKGMEDQQRGEHFTITDPPGLPSKPVKPNRVAIILLGFVLAAGISASLVALQEGMDPSLKNEDELSRITGMPVLTALTYMETDQDVRAKRIKKLIWLVGTAGTILGVIIFINAFIMPLDELWANILSRVAM